MGLKNLLRATCLFGWWISSAVNACGPTLLGEFDYRLEIHLPGRGYFIGPEYHSTMVTRAVDIVFRDPHHHIDPKNPVPLALQDHIVQMGLLALHDEAEAQGVTTTVTVRGFDAQYERGERREIKGHPVDFVFAIEHPDKHLVTDPDEPEDWNLALLGHIKYLAGIRVLRNRRAGVKRYLIDEGFLVRARAACFDGDCAHYQNWSDDAIVDAMVEIHALMRAWFSKMEYYSHHRDSLAVRWAKMDQMIAEAKDENEQWWEMMDSFKKFNLLRLGDRVGLVDVLWNAGIPGVDLEAGLN